MFVKVPKTNQFYNLTHVMYISYYPSTSLGDLDEVNIQTIDGTTHRHQIPTEDTLDFIQSLTSLTYVEE